ncbi:MAG: aspartate kinase [Proteobacteria bacterium]|nr:aspartate kinase [Pseudomonadota bacterium]
MARLIQKFGGTSVANIDRIKAVAKRVKTEVDQANQVAVVVSAMAGTTNQLVEWTRQCGVLHDAREYDVVVSAGEQITCGLLAIALQELGVDARSWLGWQIQVHSDNVHGSARIETIDTDMLDQRLRGGQVAVVAGFQGVGADNRISTFGRGGSDTSAVALAAALKADRCDIFTDVDGVYTSDPRLVPKAKKLDVVTFEEMLEFASLGAKVLQTRAVALAMRYNVNLQVRSSFSDGSGSLICAETKDMEKSNVSGVAASGNEAKVTLVGVVDTPGVAAKVFGALADANINVDMIVQTGAVSQGTTDITFSVAESDLKLSGKVLADIKDKMKYKDIVLASNLAKVSVVGVAMRSQPGIAKTMFRTLADKGINIEVISTSEIKVSVLIATEYMELAARSLHTAFGLDAR